MNKYSSDKERQAEQDRLNLLVEKKIKLQEACVLETDAGQKFKYEKELEKLDLTIKGLKQNKKGSGDERSSNGKSPWSDFFYKHGVPDELQPIITVNCNREKHYYDGLRAHFQKNLATNHNRLYCIAACPYQRPTSIAKRLVYEIAQKKLQIAFFTDDAHPEEVAVADLEFGFHPEHTWALAWDEIKKRITRNTFLPTDSLADLAAQCGEKQFIALLFRISTRHWAADSLEHLKYLIEQFKGMPSASRKYLVFLVLEFPYLHSDNIKKYQHSLSQIRDLFYSANDESHSSECIDLLPPVHADSIQLWSAEHLQKEKEAGYQEMLRLLQSASEKTRTADPDFFSMEVVETMQSAAWAHRNRPRPDFPF